MIFLLVLNLLIDFVIIAMLFITGVAISRNSSHIEAVLRQIETAKPVKKPVVGEKYEPQQQLMDLE